MPKARRLKVFQAQIGFYDTVVAVPSQPAALKAWGLRQDLFASGHAKIAEDPQAIEAAQAHPGTPLKRAVGTDAAFEVDASPSLEAPASLARRRPARRPTKSAKPKTPRPAKPPADRSRLDAAQSALEALEATWAGEAAALSRRKADLEAQIAAAREAHDKALEAARAAVRNARSAYRKAGGQD